jgi:predicted metal-dependent peptidase
MKYTLDQLEQDIDGLLMHAPFYGHVFQGVGRVISSSVDTAGVAWSGQMYVLYVNPDFFGKLRLSERRAVLKHEVLHIVFRHLTRLKTRVPHVFNIAADLAINQLCHGLPEGALHIEDFMHLGLVRNETAEEYYDVLLKKDPALLKKNTGDGEGTGESWEDCWAAKGGGRGTHARWGETTRTLEGEVLADWKAGDLALRARDMMSTRKGGGWGNMPAALVLELQKIDEERRPRVDWKQMLRTFVSGSSHSSLRTTLSRPSRRFGTHPGTRVKRKKRILVAVDTSGSTEGLREMFFEELRQIWKQGVEIWVVECDAAVGATYPFTGETPKTLSGGGGTDFQPVFDWMLSPETPGPKHRGQFDGCVYFTDGYGPTPRKPPLCRLLWVLPPFRYHYGEQRSNMPIETRWHWLTPGTLVEMSI